MSRFDVSEEDLDRLAERLASWPSNGKPDLDDTVMALRLYGLVEEKTSYRQCSACGTEKPDYRWLKITPAGRLFLRAWQEPKVSS